MKIIPANAQHIGERKEQQDAFGFSNDCDLEFVEHSGFMAVLCDGMGGMAFGKEAANTAVQTMLEAYMAKSADQPIGETLAAAVRAANQAVVDLARKKDREGDVGTTLAAAVIHADRLYWISVGDSRIYLIRGRTVSQITVDHNYSLKLEQMVRDGQLSQYEAENDPERSALISYLGLPELHEVSAGMQPFLLEPGDVVLLCSDGLYSSLAEEEIIKLLSVSPNAPDSLVEAVLAKQRPHQDNLTVAMLSCVAEQEEIGNTLRPVPVRARKRVKRFLVAVVAVIGLVAVAAGVGITVGMHFYKVYIVNPPPTAADTAQTNSVRQ